MLLLDAVYSDYSDCCDDFKLGVEYLNARLFSQATECFRLAHGSVSGADQYRNTYTSYFGISQLMQGDTSAIKFCRTAIDNEWKNADVFLNLARAEIFCENRMKAVQAIKKGFDIDGAHLGLLILRQRVGFRKKAFIPFLSRNHVVNQFVGKRLRK